jgi:hypothetical protein
MFGRHFIVSPFGSLHRFFGHVVAGCRLILVVQRFFIKVVSFDTVYGLFGAVLSLLGETLAKVLEKIAKSGSGEKEGNNARPQIYQDGNLRKNFRESSPSPAA